jgi:hypothetical protein
MEFSILAEDAELRLDLLCNIMYGLVSKNICSLTILKLRETNVTQEVIETVSGKQGVYLIDRFLGETSTFRLYRCFVDSEDSPQLILKIAKDQDYNGILDREAYLLNWLRRKADEIQRDYTAKGNAGELGYHLAYPQVLDSAEVSDQGGRRVMVLRFEIAEVLEELVPLSMVRKRDRVRIDMWTSAWLLGKYLKLLTFVHQVGVSVGNLTPSNLLAQRDAHLIAVFDWTKAERYHAGIVPQDRAQSELLAVVRAVRSLLMEVDGKSIPPDNHQDPDGRYRAKLEEMMLGREVDALHAHAAFYELVEEIWGRRFHPWTNFPL